MIYWAFNRYSASQIQEDIQNLEGYFSYKELSEYHKFLVPKRKMEWLASRILVKRLVVNSIDPALALSPRSITIRKMPSGAPYIFVVGIGKMGRLSLSHSNDGVLAAFSPDAAYPFGVDLELIEARSPLLVADYFTDMEINWMNSTPREDKDFLVNLVWSAKEAYLKALGKGLQLDTRRVEITGIDLMQTGDEWGRLIFRKHLRDIQDWRLLFRQEEHFVLTMCFPANAPIEFARIDLGLEKPVTLKSSAWEYTA